MTKLRAKNRVIGESHLLDLYFRNILRIFALLLPPFCYLPLSITGYFFRNLELYCSGVGPGVLVSGMESIKSCLNINNREASNVLKEYLKFESRFALENHWIATHKRRMVEKAFKANHLRMLEKELIQRPRIIVTAHTSGLYLLVELLKCMGCSLKFVMMNMLNQPYDSATAIQRSAMPVVRSWQRQDIAIFVEQRAMWRCREALKNDSMIIIAPDAPGYSKRGVPVSMWNRTIFTAVGPAKLSAEAHSPLLVVIPWAATVTDRYSLLIKRLDPPESIQECMQNIYNIFQTLFSRYPACWAGWLYLDRMTCE